MKKKIANWGNYPVIESDERKFSYIEEALQYAKTTEGFIPRGNGRCYGDASLANQTISTLDYNNILSFDTELGIFECQSGLTLDKILEVIIPKKWFLPVTPGTKFITVGGAVASDIHGKNHHVEGSFSQHIREMDVLLSSGEIVTCSPSSHKDLFWATCGGMGLTGIITRIKFNLKEIESSYIKQKQLKARSLEEVIHLFEENKHYTYSVAWIDCLKKGEHLGRSILILGEHAKINELPRKKKQAPLKLPARKKIVLPFNLPSFILNRLTVKAFNFLYYESHIRKETNNIVSYEPFFYPLDAVLNWNRGYGKNGFIQYQFVLPLNCKQGLIEILKRISETGLGSFLAVLKIFGKQNDLISFPMEGFTLALDFPVRKGLFTFLDELDQIVLSYGGRLYMSKDARMKPAVLKEGYIKLPQFIEIIKKYNPDAKIRSQQSDRLFLTRN